MGRALTSFQTLPSAFPSTLTYHVPSNLSPAAVRHRVRFPECGRSVFSVTHSIWNVSTPPLSNHSRVYAHVGACPHTQIHSHIHPHGSLIIF